jgi:flagellar biosynthetic protein FlhB
LPEFDGDKSLEATPHRREEARKHGHVPRSHDLATVVVLLLGLLWLGLLGNQLLGFLGALLKEQLGGAAWLEAGPDFVVAESYRLLLGLGQVLLPVFGLVLVAAVVANVVQVGFFFLPEKALPDITRLDPLQGARRVFSLANAVRLLFGIFKIAVIGLVAYVSLAGKAEEILALTEHSVPEIARYLGGILFWTTVKIGIALLVLAILDYLFQRWKYERDIRMTPRELREELKNLEGNPEVLSRRRAVQRQLTLSRISSAVPKADVVITNPTEIAVAIQYVPDEMAAPIVVAKGAGFVAERIRRLALEHGIPVLERKPLAQALYREVNINQPIPRDKYAAVAEVLAYVYQLKGKRIPEPPS